MNGTQIPNMPPINPISPPKFNLLDFIRGQKLIVKIIGAVIILTIVGVGTALATRIWDPLWNPFRPSPEKVIEEMVSEMEKIKTLHSEIKIGIEIEDEKEKAMTISLTMNTDSDSTDLKNFKASTDFDITITAANLKESFSLAGESREIGDMSYLKMTKIDIPFNFQPLLMMLGIDKNKVQGQWIKLDKESLKTLGMQAQEPELSKEEQVKLIEKSLKLFEEKKVYYVKKELADQKVKGKKAYHYLLSIDRENLKEIIPELLETVMEFSGEETSGVDEFGTAFIAGGLAESINKFLEKIGGIDFEIWIGKKDLLLYKVKIDKEIDASVFEKEAEGKMTISFGIEFSDFNKPVEIKKPKKFIKLEEIISPMFFTPPLKRFPETTSSSQLIMEKDNSSLFQASISEFLLNVFK